jgi:hypothetical protein
MPQTTISRGTGVNCIAQQNWQPLPRGLARAAMRSQDLSGNWKKDRLFLQRDAFNSALTPRR